MVEFARTYPKSQPAGDLPWTSEELRQAIREIKPVVLRTVKSDKYDRYLADLWVGETYVNGALTAAGLADRLKL